MDERPTRSICRKQNAKTPRNGLAVAASRSDAAGYIYPLRPFGRTQVQVPRWDLGTSSGRCERRIDRPKIGYTKQSNGNHVLDNRREYHRVRSRFGWARRSRAVVTGLLVTDVCTHGRDKALGLRLVEESLLPREPFRVPVIRRSPWSASISRYPAK